jgi:hypothetical protein
VVRRESATGMQLLGGRQEIGTHPARHRAAAANRIKTAGVARERTVWSGPDRGRETPVCERRDSSEHSL